MEVGGQAVMEGVMMRNQERYAVAVRLKNGKIKIKKEKNSQFPKLFKLPFIRGIVGLVFTLYDGIKALIWSSNQSLGEEEKLSSTEVVLTLLGAFLMAVLFFMVLPFFLAKILSSGAWWFDLLDGVVRVGLFISYLLIISKMKDVKKLFNYHGAEHKTIACYEAGEELKVENVKKYSRFHPRCGTSFIFMVLVLSVILFSLVSGSWLVKFLGRLVLLPVIAGIGYELVKLSGKYRENWFVKIIVAPGLWLQRLTTNEPDEKQMEVGIKALKNVVE